MPVSPDDREALRPEDANGHVLQVGDHVRIPRMPDWLLQDLSEAERGALNVFADRPIRIHAFDAFGYAWFGDDTEWLCVRPDETVQVSSEEDRSS